MHTPLTKAIAPLRIFLRHTLPWAKLQGKGELLSYCLLIVVKNTDGNLCPLTAVLTQTAVAGFRTQRTLQSIMSKVNPAD